MPEFYNGMYPKPRGATDYMDSAHLVGMMVYAGMHIDINTVSEYVNSDGYAMRCPINDGCDLQPNNYKNFTRDQFIPFISALYELKQYGTMRRVISHVGLTMWNTESNSEGSKKKFPNGPDILDPSHHGYLRILINKKPLFFQRWWMIADIIFTSLFFPMKEPNNLIIMSHYYGYTELLKRMNPKLKDAICKYWSGWRDEKQLADMICRSLGV